MAIVEKTPVGRTPAALTPTPQILKTETVPPDVMLDGCTEMEIVLDVSDGSLDIATLLSVRVLEGLTVLDVRANAIWRMKASPAKAVEPSDTLQVRISSHSVLRCRSCGEGQ